METVKIKFIADHNYRDRVFRAGQTYELSEECPGFINRWLIRGCILVEDAPVVTETVVEEKEEVIAVPEVVEEEEKIVENKKSKKRSTKK